MGNFFCQKLTMDEYFDEKRTLKVSGISQFVREQIEKEIEKTENSIKFNEDDVNKLWVCPGGKDYVLVEFDKDIPVKKKIVDALKIGGTVLKVERWKSKTASNESESVSRIWRTDLGVPVTSPYNGDISTNSTEGKGGQDTRKRSQKEARHSKFDERRSGINSDQDKTSETPFNDTKLKLNDHWVQKIKEETKLKAILKDQNVKLDDGYLSGTWNAISAVKSFIGYYIPGSGQTETENNQRKGSSQDTESDQPIGSPTSPFDQPAQDKLSVNSFFLRYILAYHYEVFEKLESVSKEISFEEKSKCDKDLKITAREKVDGETFSKTVDEFIAFYQSEHQKMHQEDVHTKPQIDKAAISEARLKFSVVIDSTTESDKLTIYGEKDKVVKAKRFLQSKVVSSSPDNDLSKGIAAKELTAKGATAKKATEKGSISEKLSCELAKNVKLVVYQGDITKEEVDAIVNPANDRLKHEGGAALAIAKAGGKSIQDACDEIMKKRGRQLLQTGEVEITSAGKLPCKFVLHAVGPIWSNHPPNTAMNLLYNAVHNSLYWACYNGARSISIPAISSGVYKVPVDICARVLFDTVIAFTGGSNQPIPLQEIHFVNIDYPTNRTFSQEMEKRFAGYINREYIEAHLSKTSKGQDKEMHNQQSQAAFSLSNSRHPKRPPGTAQPMNAAYIGSSDNHSADDKSKGRNPSGGQPHKTFLTYSEAAAGKKTDTSDPKPGTDDGASKDDECCICLSGFTNKKTLKCGHSFCSKCIENAFKVKKQCPVCSTVYGPLTGDQPDGMMYDSYQSTQVPGFRSRGTIVISYRFPSGIQGPNHPNPGKPYQGTHRTAYLPNNEEGKKVLKLLKKAFDQKLTFTIGRSTTTGREDVVTWNDIHHKTSIYGGPTNYGYPDPDYLKRVQDELAAKGITE